MVAVRATSDEDFIGLESSLELSRNFSFIGEKKKSCHFGMKFSFKFHSA